MAIKFTTETEQYTTATRNARVKHFTEYTSKKQLQDAGVLTGEELEFALSIRGTFSFALHEGGRYMAVTMYKATSAERKYGFLVLDLQEKALAEIDSIKNAKAEILALVAETQTEQPQETEDAEETDESTDEDDKKLKKKVKDVLDEVLGDEPEQTEEA